MALMKNLWTFDLAMRMLTQTFEDPMASSLCASRLQIVEARVTLELMSHPTITTKSKFAKSHPELLRAGIGFLTQKRSPAQVDALVRHFIDCRCDLEDPGMRQQHILGQRPPVSLNMYAMKHIINTMIELVNLALIQTAKNKFRSRNTHSRVQPWPLSPEDLLPYGTEDTIDALAAWSTSGAAGYIVYKLAATIGMFYEPLGEAIIRPPDYNFVLQRPMAILTETMDSYQANPAHYATMQDEVSHPICAIMNFYEMLFLSHAGKLNTVLKEMSTTISPVLKRLQRLLPSLPGYGTWIRDPTKAIGLILSIVGENPAFDPSSARRSNPFGWGLEQMIATKKGGCNYPSCPQTQDTKYAPRCSGCDLARFCSKDCQTKAWKMKEFPHKELCLKVRSLREKLGPQVWPKLCVEGTTAEQAASLLKRKNVDLNSVAEIGSFLSATLTMKVWSRG